MTRPHRHGGPPSPEEDAAIAVEALAEGDYKHAADHLAAALAENPGHAPWLSLVDRLKEAPDPLATVPIDGTNAPYFGTAALRGLLLSRLGQPAEGLKLYLDVLSQRPERTGYIAWVLDAVRSPKVLKTFGAEQALGFIGELLRSPAANGEIPNPQAVLASYEPLLQEFLRAFPQDVMIHLASSYILRRAGQTAEAEAAARAAYGLRPDALTSAACASAMRDAGRLEEAVAMFRQGLERDPAADEVRLDLADTLLDAGRVEEALRDYEVVLGRTPDHPWALPSKYFCRWQLASEADWLRKLQEFAAGQPENTRASDLLGRCTPYERFLPGPTEATINIMKKVVTEGLQVQNIGTSSLEAPSVHLCLRMSLGKDIHISIPALQKPDPTVPRRPVKHLLWKYDANLDPQPQGPPPQQSVATAIASIAAQSYDRESWWSAAHATASDLGPAAVPAVLGVMVHPPPAPKGAPSWIWIHQVQFAAAFVAAHQSWKDLLDVARGPMDWTVEAAVVALARVAIERREAQEEVLALCRELGSSIPRPGYCCYEYALRCVVPWLPNASDEDKAEAVRQRREMERSWAEASSPPAAEPKPRERLSPMREGRARRIREEYDRKYSSSKVPAGSRRPIGQLVLILAVVAVVSLLINAFVRGFKAPSEEPAPKEAIQLRTMDGKLLTAKDLENLTGRFQWELIGHEQTTADAERLHQRAREAGGKGDYDSALKDLTEAQRLSPRWPYPTYDMAWTYLLQGDPEKAEQYYAKVVELAPRGYFSAITALDCLRKEKEGKFPRGLYKNFVMLEWIPGEEERKKLLQGIVDKVPTFAPAWSELGSLTENDSERHQIIEKGLAASPDPETKGMLLINKALLLERQGKRPEGLVILAKLITDRSSTVATEHLAKFAVTNLKPKK
jgi:tetratricopeptide (TPR) repeat protein